MKALWSLHTAILIGTGMLVAVGSANASSETALYSFQPNVFPYGRLLLEKSGALLGTTLAGGAENLGTVYEVKPAKHGWKETNIYSFSGTDGAYPSAGGTEGANAHTFYGVTSGGPDGDAGTVFSLIHNGRSWTERILHGFSGSGSDGRSPMAPLLRDQKSGVTYGTTADGGNFGCGTVFQIDGAGAYRTDFSFDSYSQGCVPLSQLQRWSSAGTFIGTTSQGGDANAGNIFLLSEKQGKWKESVVHALDGGSEGVDPVDLTTRSSNGAAYGVTEYGGVNGAGVVFEVDADLQYHVIYTFTGATDGHRPVGLCLDSNTGKLYGATFGGGVSSLGTVFQLEYDGKAWVETVLHNFAGGKDGANPVTRPIVDSAQGWLYGTTSSEGKNGGGTVYQIAL